MPLLPSGCLPVSLPCISRLWLPLPGTLTLSVSIKETPNSLGALTFQVLTLVLLEKAEPVYLVPQNRPPQSMSLRQRTRRGRDTRRKWDEMVTNEA